MPGANEGLAFHVGRALQPEIALGQRKQAVQPLVQDQDAAADLIGLDLGRGDQLFTREEELLALTAQDFDATTCEAARRLVKLINAVHGHRPPRIDPGDQVDAPVGGCRRLYRVRTGDLADQHKHCHEDKHQHFPRNDIRG